MTDAIDLAGAVDLHTHVGPSPFGRRVDGAECARECAAAGMDAVVFKEHFLPTAYGTDYVDRLLPATEDAPGDPVTGGAVGDSATEDAPGGIEAIGSIVLNYANGGFNPFAVDAALQYGAGVVWGPTIDARHHARRTGELGSFLGVEAGPEYDDVEGITPLEEGELTRDARLCVEKVADAGAVLALGHLSFEEHRALVEYAADLGHDRVVIDHPNYGVTDLSLAQQRELVSLGATLNFPYLAISEEYGWIDDGALADNVRAVGVDDCVVSSDTGQATTPSSPEALRALGETLLDHGVSRAGFETLVETNPKRLLGLD